MERGGNCVRAKTQEEQLRCFQRCMLGLANLRLAFISSDSKMMDSHEIR